MKNKLFASIAYLSLLLNTLTAPLAVFADEIEPTDDTRAERRSHPGKSTNESL